MPLQKTNEVTDQPPGGAEHLAVLDGWRGLSILMVLAAHLLPLGPNYWKFNDAAGIFGMVLFFILSGFLITSFLIRNQNIPSFLIRRFFRVIPLAWLYLFISLVLSHASFAGWYTHFLFYANMPPKDLLPLTDHMWSLCVEVQFYIGVALLVGLFKKRGLYILPVLCIFFTGVRVWDGVHAASITYYRIDEILAGCTLALLYHSQLIRKIQPDLDSKFQCCVLVLLICSCSPYSGWFNYFRPYLAAILIGSTILKPDTSLVKFLNNKWLFYLARISFSLYVIHPILAHSWLGSGDVIVKYMKRPLLFLVLFMLAMLSTKYFESWFIEYGRKLSNKFKASGL
ncbi:acyltransferase [Actimicrobium sp. CCC2.4]|uniref:acyltransferase family protein n=1 Tax=Actimicrobium sp. CCC2.4 TaxID=3048606 RepID=UPI002AC98C4A|nr:acyltransferase [Actimicrobium sp. CCC2.4]MEB0136032.1 acyltransferase [Actimicrobium sp. CCC2.4]WPX32695.1 acyltransferase [Actimicrobium sp. CCC2.4]